MKRIGIAIAFAGIFLFDKEKNVNCAISHDVDEYSQLPYIPQDNGFVKVNGYIPEAENHTSEEILMQTEAQGIALGNVNNAESVNDAINSGNGAAVVFEANKAGNMIGVRKDKNTADVMDNEDMAQINDGNMVTDDIIINDKPIKGKLRSEVPDLGMLIQQFSKGINFGGQEIDPRMISDVLKIVENKNGGLNLGGIFGMLKNIDLENIDVENISKIVVKDDDNAKVDINKEAVHIFKDMGVLLEEPKKLIKRVNKIAKTTSFAFAVLAIILFVAGTSIHIKGEEMTAKSAILQGLGVLTLLLTLGGYYKFRNYMKMFEGNGDDSMTSILENIFANQFEDGDTEISQHMPKTNGSKKRRGGK